jgi:predicted membrane-bound spermidine synthase
VFTDIRYAYLVVFLASFCGMTLELTASRVLAQQLGVSLFTWTGIIGVMLAGTALGNFTGGHLADRPRSAFAWLGAIAAVAVLLATGLAVAYAFQYPVTRLLGAPLTQADVEDSGTARFQQLRMVLAVVGSVSLLVGVGVFRLLRVLPDLDSVTPRHTLAATLCFAGAGTVSLFVTMPLITRLELFAAWEPVTQVMGWTFGLFFVPMFVLGLVSPQVIRLAVPDVAHAGRVAGRVYAWSTVGAIVGTFGTGYVLLSALGMHRTILGAALVLVFASLIVARVWDNNPLLYLFSIVLGGITGGFILTARDREDGIKVESNYYTIKVSPSRYRGVPETALNLNLDRLLHSIVDPYDPTFLHYTHEYVQVEFVRLARTASPEPKVLVIGGGGYTFPRYLMSKIPEAHVDVVEIDPKVTEVAYKYLGLEPNPHLNPVHMDGRQFVAERAAPGSYDLVVQDAVNDLSVPAHLMTKEYNDAVKGALKPDGVYLLTIIDSVADGKLWKAGMATLKKTFAHVLLLRVRDEGEGEQSGWFENRHVLVIYASDRPFSEDAIRAAVAGQVPTPDAKALRASLAVAGLFTPTPLSSVAPFPVPVRTTVVNPDLLAYFTDRDAPAPPEVLRRLANREAQDPSLPPPEWTANREPGVVLTDQFCPVDNLMAEVFRRR